MSLQGLASLAIDRAAIETARRIGRAACIVVTVIGVIALLYSLPLALGLPLAALLVPGMSWQTWRLGFLGRRYAVASIRYSDDSEWQVLRRDRWLSASLRPESRVWRRLVWLSWNTEDGVMWTLLTRAATPPTAWRQLQAQFRLPNVAHRPGQSNTAPPTA